MLVTSQIVIKLPTHRRSKVQTFVNDETTTRQDMNSSLMIFSCTTIISYTSK